MQSLILREFNRWKSTKSGSSYLGLPDARFSSDCPPMLCIGGKTLGNLAPRLLVVSLEPLRDERTFSQQLD